MREVVRTLDADASHPLPTSTSGGARQSRRRRRLPILIAAALVALGGSAVGWALVASSGRDSVAVECEIEGSSAVIPAASGDPVADCAAQWQRDTGSPAPPLVAYDNGNGGVTVLPAGQPPPSGFARLPGGATQNVSMVEMQQWLDDYVNGLNSGCFDGAKATQMTQRELARLGMAGWTVQPPPASDSGSCVDTGILDASNRTVTLRAMRTQSPPDSTEGKLAAKLRWIAQECASLDATAKQVRSAASELGLSEDARQYQLSVVPDDAARCTRIYENVGGAIFLILRGPSG